MYFYVLHNILVKWETQSKTFIQLHVIPIHIKYSTEIVLFLIYLLKCSQSANWWRNVIGIFVKMLRYIL